MVSSSNGANTDSGGSVEREGNTPPQEQPHWLKQIYNRHIDTVRARLIIAVILILGTGVFVAPSLGSRVYLTDKQILGTPASEKIKAPQEINVIDNETTLRLRKEAEDQVRRVYDFDILVAKKIEQNITQSFTLVKQELKKLYEEHPNYLNPDKLSTIELNRRFIKQGEIFTSIQPEIEKILGLSLSDEEKSFLKDIEFSENWSTAVTEILVKALNKPVIDDAVLLQLQPDAERGIQMQTVPADGTESSIHRDIHSIANLAELKDNIAKQIKQGFVDYTEEEKSSIKTISWRLLKPNLYLNRAATEIARQEARSAIKPVAFTIKKDEIVIRDGDPYTDRHLLILDQINQISGSRSTILVTLGGSLAILVLIFTAFGLGRRKLWKYNLETRDLLFLTSLFLFNLLGVRLWLLIVMPIKEVFSNIPSEVFLFLIPVASGTVIVRLILRMEMALVFSFVSSLTIGMMVESEREFIIYALVGTILGATSLRTMDQRSDLLRTGLWIGIGQAAIAVALQLLDAQTTMISYVAVVPVGFLSGILSAIVALAMTSVVEFIFGYTTNLKLLELANLNHPALKELIVQAPGSYHHSIIVGSLAEAAAEEIHANVLLTRVMAYYHDIGKGSNPGYFAENIRGVNNPHDKLKPSMSAMIIKRHISDGLDMAKKYGLGEQIMEGIAEHHGNTIIQFFFQKAKEKEDESDPVSDQDYRYPGRKPQSREAALVMLADSIEAASRTVAEPTTARMQGLVNRIINNKFTDGQLEQSDLTLRDLHSIAKAFTRVLNSIYHDRPNYPSVLKDLSGKRQNGDSDTKQSKRKYATDAEIETDRPDDIKRLGLNGR